MAVWLKDKDGNRVKAAGIGVPGTAGKTAYQYAVDGGFSGTEGEFSTMLAGRGNPSLLDNARWDRGENIINQRNVSGTITAPGYFIDRWKLVSGSVTITEGGLMLNGTMAQILEAGPGREVTASYLTDGSVLPAEYDSGTRAFSITAEGTLIRAAKLELGTQQTLAHQDGDGNWVLNDPPPDKALELAKCQRHQIVFSSNGGRAVLGFGVGHSASNALIHFILPQNLRTTPAIIAEGNFLLDTLISGSTPIENVVIVQSGDTNGLYSSNIFTVYARKDGGIQKGTVLYYLEGTDPTSKIILDANL